MNLSKCEVVLFLWFCCYLLLATAQNGVTHPNEVKALRAIKNNLIDVNRNLSNWNQGDPCINRWTGVLCHDRRFNDGYFHVRELQLLRMNLSGKLAPEIGNFTYLEILDFMWNKISGTIPKEIGNIITLKLLLLNGNKLIGPLPEELGYLPNLIRMQIDQNNINGSIPSSFANLNACKHFHMNNNSLSGPIPPELSQLPNLFHLLLDTNNLTGTLPPDLSKMPRLKILQLDNNNFSGSTIPESYGDMSRLFKLSLRNCNLKGPIPDLSRIPNLYYIDLSHNQLNETIPTNQLSGNITTIVLSNNNLSGTIPLNFSNLPRLKKLSIANNKLSGNVPSSIWQNKTSSANESLIVDLQNNELNTISGSTTLPSNVTLQLGGNPLCKNNSFAKFCGSQGVTGGNGSSGINCPGEPCSSPYEYSVDCVCSAPLYVDYRLKSPGFGSDFPAFMSNFQTYLTDGLKVETNQLHITDYEWEEGPRLRMNLKVFPATVNNTTTNQKFNDSEYSRIRSTLTGWNISDSDLFGPYELMDLPAYSQGTRISIKIEGVRVFVFEELAAATNNFSESSQVGRGGYGKVYKGILADGTAVAIKRAQEGSLQGEREFLTEIQLLSRLHHRNLVSLIGYCDEEGEQMLVYEYMPNGTLRDHLSPYSRTPLNFTMRMKIALGSAKGLLYLHTEADPPIFHRDVKASNILLDSKFNAKVADFGLSRLAPVPDVEGVVPGHVSTVVKGTPGYLDPEYFLTRKLTDKSDVYSLGVVFLEIATGRAPISHGKNIIRQVTSDYQSGGLVAVMDERLGPCPSECVQPFLTLALKCCEDVPDDRPKMAEVVRELENIWSMIPESNGKVAEYVSSDSGTLFSSQPSSSIPFASVEISGSDLISGDIPTIKPR
nr:probable LRR receptor-like serine/threonine-protein kinase At1g06840 isoform X2 [Arachis hypogaea]